MRRIWFALAALALILSLPIVGILGYLRGMHSTWYWDGRATTVSRLSPDETILARLVEVSPTPSLDRKFRLHLQHFDHLAMNSIFLSPDEAGGGPPGTERLIWSRDGTKILLVGRHFFVKDDLFLDNGDQLYFLYDVPTARGWCNSEAPVSFPPLKAETIDGIEFTEPVKLRK